MSLIYFAGSNTVAKTCIASQQGVAEWLMRWPRDPRSIEVGKPASGPLARRGSNPFPGANLPVKVLRQVILYKTAQSERS